MKKILLSAGLLLAMNCSFASSAVKSNSGLRHTTSVSATSAIKVKYNLASCTATASIGIGANKIELSATAATCKEAIAMLKAVME
ncbi:hypothetical protein [Mucilaginibacter sp.]|uniref:hypothetical protein n=1 Tax=Mucilaginibacter sp. TaxID=1882438 RepID=UPI003264C291